ncbi:acetyl-CoA carboxylase biotin carboxyl carrier protein subunit [Bradyrhizobium oligotrophicum]|uniref:acetyl-CoA carboxylase biotin carboxyl carrier protein subunit n=1 Tax=Bradyrhizobium oligotrophicum TaxID=44255 RepID=UPI003EBD07D0
MNKQLYARLDGLLYDVCVKAGQKVQTGEVLYVIEAAKSQLSVKAPYSGTISQVRRTAGETLSATDVVMELDAEDAAA